MTPKTKTALLKAAQGVAELPLDFELLRLMANFPTQIDWDDYNGNLCRALDNAFAPDELDDFWKENKTFEDMGIHIDETCGF